jgi:glycosyltransferase involved in cell wall biosynthesis
LTVRGSDRADISPLSRVAVIIPALNEADNLRQLLPKLDPLGIGQVIVGDNGSDDGTAAAARENGATVASAPVRGYGAACYAALRRLRPETEVVVFMDADQSDDPSLIFALASPILNDECDLVIGTRVATLRQPGSMTLPQRFGDKLATALIEFGWGYRFGDLGPFRAIRRSALDTIQMRDRAFGWTIEMQIRAVELNLRIQQLPVPYHRRIGVSKISGNIRGVARAGYWILSTWWRLWRTRKTRTEA